MKKEVYLAENLAYIRKQKKLRQNKLAEKIGVQPNTISNYEKGVSLPDLVTLGRIRRVFNISADDLAYLEPALFQHKYPGRTLPEEAKMEGTYIPTPGTMHAPTGIGEYYLNPTRLTSTYEQMEKVVAEVKAAQEAIRSIQAAQGITIGPSTRVESDGTVYIDTPIPYRKMKSRKEERE